MLSPDMAKAGDAAAETTLQRARAPRSVIAGLAKVLAKPATLSLQLMGDIARLPLKNSYATAPGNHEIVDSQAVVIDDRPQRQFRSSLPFLFVVEMPFPYSIRTVDRENNSVGPIRHEFALR